MTRVSHKSFERIYDKINSISVINLKRNMSNLYDDYQKIN